MGQANLIYPWQQDQWARLSQVRASGRMPHAWLVAGPGGVGLRRFAEAWGQSLLCESEATVAPCGRCRGCRLYAAGTHPDSVAVEPSESGKAIPVDAIRALSERLVLKGASATKVALVDPAEALTTAAANSLLKTLEEPAGGTCILLVTRRVARLPATIRSRCQRAAFGVPDTSVVHQWLRDCGVSDPGHWLAVAGGLPLRALDHAHAAPGQAAATDAVVATLVTALESGVVPSSAGRAAGLALSDSVPIISSTVEDVLRLAYAPRACRLRRPEWRARMEGLAQRLDGPALFDYLDEVYRSVPSASSSLRSDSQFVGLMADAAQVKARVAASERG